MSTPNVAPPRKPMVTPRLPKTMPANSPGSLSGTASLLPPGVTPERMEVFQKAGMIQEGSVIFCNRFIGREAETRKRILAAAREGKQFALQFAWGTDQSIEKEVRLLQNARAGFDNLVDCLHKFLKLEGHAIWSKRSREGLYARRLSRGEKNSFETCRTLLETRPPRIATNILIVLTSQTTTLLDRMISERVEAD